MRTTGLRATIEFTLTVEVAVRDPYRDVDLWAEFVGPGGERFRRPAFWDGGSTWRVRFAPTAVGEWAFTTTGADGLPGLHDVAGRFACVASEQDLPVQRHGFLEVAPGGHHLQHQDGRPFFWLADTHWRFASEQWDESNKPGWASQFRDTVRHRVEQGFTVYQGNLLSYELPEFWAEAEDYSSIDPAYFRDTVDPRMAYIAEAGLVHALGLAWYDAVDRDPEGMARFARYVVARYGSYPVIWTLAGEVAGYDPALREQRLAAWREVALAMREADAYGHPLTAHLTTERPLASYYQDEPWLDFTLNQLGHGDLDMRAHHWTEHLARFPKGPLVEGESFYEGMTSVEYTGRRIVTDTMVRQVAYRAIQSGCCGYSYGAQGCWNNAWDEEEARIVCGDLTWREGVDLPGADQLGHLRRLYESVDWWRLRPAPELFAGAAINETFFAPAVSADPERRIVLVYFGETYRFEEGPQRLLELPAVEYSLEWFDPRTGGRTAIAEGERPDATVPGAAGVVPLPAAPGPGDWMLLARAR